MVYEQSSCWLGQLPFDGKWALQGPLKYHLSGEQPANRVDNGRPTATVSRKHCHEFWPDTVSLSDQALFNLERLLSPKHLTDIYLLGLATSHKGRLVTFDRTIPTGGVRRFKAENLVVL